MWTDPEFDPALHAFYYARVLEIPTPRWTTIQAAKLGIAPPDVVAATLQERAWSSPIWYTPSADARKSAKVGTTVDALRKQGAMPVGDAELKKLLVEKSVWLQNDVTDEKWEIVYGASGKAASGKPDIPIEPGYVARKFGDNQAVFQVRYVGKRSKLPSLTGDVADTSYLGLSQPYYINNG